MNRLPRISAVCLSLLIALASSQLLAREAGTDAPATNSETVSLTVEGITRNTGDDDPGVLYILPWQPPTLPRRTRAELEAGSEDLLEPKDPLTLERHRKFRETLNPSLDSTLSLQ
ncbi:hypothetical protein QPM17_00925 [Marinobacter sp. TBZ242]|uniref:Secreted protein n=1 Tax=Marinobacter azerbaijanicus TaxID=3050455 RepID=A0ABT7I7M8_9GAMM|nr:hypothetical protein [Marinobacter sp. TBZ242]MDL0429675.1 hypothetical protein [Marinobacter sp. TBZ242]